MCAKSISKQAELLAGRLSSARSLLLITHTRPDGDGLGSAGALARAGATEGIDSAIYVPVELPARHEHLVEGLKLIAGKDLESSAAKADAIVIVDTSAHSQLPQLEEFLSAHRDKVLVIDHHATGDDIGCVAWRDHTAAAAGVMVYELLAYMGWSIDEISAQMLATAILCDTGWLRFSNTDARSLFAMANLVSLGARPDELHSKLDQSDSHERLQLLHRVLGSLQLHNDASIATMILTQDDFSQVGAEMSESENFVNEPLRISTVQVSIMLVEHPDSVRVSLRSKGDVDVAAIAGHFGGGGHAKAAGLTGDLPLEELKNRIIALISEQ